MILKQEINEKWIKASISILYGSLSCFFFACIVLWVFIPLPIDMHWHACRLNYMM